MSRLRQMVVLSGVWFLSAAVAFAVMASSIVCESAPLTSIGGGIKFGTQDQLTTSGASLGCQEFFIQGSGEVSGWQGVFRFGTEFLDNTAKNVSPYWYGSLSASGKLADQVALKLKTLRGVSFLSSRDLLQLVDGSRYDRDTTGVTMQVDVRDLAVIRAARVDMVDNVGDDGCLTFVEAEVNPVQRWSLLLDAAVLSPHPVEHVLKSGATYTTFTAQRILSMQARHRVTQSLRVAAQLAVEESEELTKSSYVKGSSLAGCMRMETAGRVWSQPGGGYLQLAAATEGFRSFLGDKTVRDDGLTWEIGGYWWPRPDMGLRATVANLDGGSDSGSFAKSGWELRYLKGKSQYQLNGDDDECMLTITSPRKRHRAKSLKTSVQYRWSTRYWRTNVAGLRVLSSDCVVDYRENPSAYRAAFHVEQGVWQAEVVCRRHRIENVCQVFVKVQRETEFGSISMYYGNDDGGKLDAGWKKAPALGVGCQIKL